MSIKQVSQLVIASLSLITISCSTAGRYSTCVVGFPNPTLRESFEILVPPNESENLERSVQELSRSLGMTFAAERYPAGAAGIAHPRLVMQVCGRGVDINILNNEKEEHFSAYVAILPAADESAFSRSSGQFRASLGRRYVVGNYKTY